MFKFKNDIVHGALFDMDGTMFDTERLRFQTLKQASKELIGVEFSDAYLMACLGLSARSAEALAQKQYGQEVPYAEIRKRADELELETVRQYGVPIKKGLPICSAIANGTPAPWSRILIVRSTASQSTVTSSPSGQASAALFNRLSNA